MDSAHHPHQRSITDYREQPHHFISPSQEESVTLKETLHMQCITHDEQIKALIGILLRDTEEGEEFMIETIFDNIDLGNTDRRVLGALVQRAKSLHLIECVDHQPSKVPGHHRLQKAVWRRV